ncbi:MAG: hypothetical protein R3Y47_05170 [Lachnospiraceae bacterium]
MFNFIHKVKQGTFKNWAIISALIGFLACAIFGKKLVLAYGFLDEVALNQIVDATINQYAYLFYCLSKQIIILILFALSWYKGWGLLMSRFFVVIKSMQLGVCLQVCLMRYGLIGVLLWILLYMPHTLFYAIFYGFIIWIVTKKIEKSWLLYLMIIASFVLSLYLESYSNVEILQSFLKKISF